MNTANAYNYEHSVKVAPISDLYVPQTNGEISSSIMQNWTQQAIECYEVGSNCSKCSLSSGNYSFICQMPKIVKALIQEFGEPNVAEIETKISQ